MRAIPALHAAISAAPRIPGLRLRAPGGPGDYGPMAEVFAAAAAADGLDEIVTAPDIANFIENPIDSDPAFDTVIAEVEGRIIGYAWTSHKLEASGENGQPATEIHQHRGYVHPEWRRRGLATAILERFWRRAEARRLSDDPATPRLLQSFLLESETGGHALVRRFGYRPIRYSFIMRRDLSQPIPSVPLPEGLEVRPALPEHRRQIWEAEREAFQDHWGYAPWPEGAYQRFLNFPHYDLSLWRVAWDGDQVAGSVLSYINEEENRLHGRRLGWAEDISVRRPWRRRGLARALISSSLEALKARGMSVASLGVDAENRTGALRLYESLGFVVSSQWTIYRRPLPDANEASG
jgi:ribosomal protein S18 acetylase RimI-like enzyme